MRWNIPVFRRHQPLLKIHINDGAWKVFVQFIVGIQQPRQRVFEVDDLSQIRIQPVV
jgi:hypothetical protein